MKKIIIASVLTAISFYSQAQNKQSTEIGFNLGSSNYLGDLQTENKTYNWPGFSTGFFVRQNMNPFFAFKSFINYARISGNDAKTHVQGQLNRNLSFRSHIVEMGIVGEMNLLPHDRRTEKYARHFNATPYLFGGLNFFHFNPKTYYNGQWVELQPLCTEGQNTSISNQSQYSLNQIALPFGMGFKFQVSKQLTFGIEFGARKTFTDYLDDVSGNYTDATVLAAEKGTLAAELTYRGDEVKGNELTTSYLGEQRGNSSNKDWYLINNISISYKFYNRQRSRF